MTIHGFTLPTLLESHLKIGGYKLSEGEVLRLKALLTGIGSPSQGYGVRTRSSRSISSGVPMQQKRIRERQARSTFRDGLIRNAY